MVARYTNFGALFATTLFFRLLSRYFFLYAHKTLEFGPGDIAPLLSSFQRSGGPWA
jgi:hypothetical protein